MLNIDPPWGSVLLPICCSNACTKQYTRWISTLPWGRFCYPDVVPTRAKDNANVEYWSAHGVNLVTHMSLQRPWGQFCSPYVAPTRVKSNRNVEHWSTHGVGFVTHTSLQCVRKIVQMLNIDPPMGSVLLPYVAPTRVKYNANAASWTYFGTRSATHFAPKGRFSALCGFVRPNS